MLRKARYEMPFLNYKETYAYELRATGKLSKPLSVVMHIEMLFNAKFEVRILRDNKWVQIPATNNLTQKTVTFVLHEITNFALVVPDSSLTQYNELLDTAEKKFAHYTNRMLAKMPVWSKLRRNPVNSTGAAFLNIFGLEFEEMKFILDYAVDQQYISTLDTARLDWVSKFDPDIKLVEENIIKIWDDNSILQETNNLEDFLTYDDKGSYRPKILYDNPFIVDYEEQVVYIRKHHRRIKVEVFDNSRDRKIIHEKIYEPEWHHIWGFLDEFAMLLNLRRLPYEPNEKLKERVIDVFINPSSASKEGLMNGIARELGIRKNAVWSRSDDKPFIIEDPMVVVNYIKVNEYIVPKEYITFNEKGHVVISPYLRKPEPAKSWNPLDSMPVIVSWVTGFEMHTFFKATVAGGQHEMDWIFRHQLYDADGIATKLFRYYVQRIKHDVPIEWGWFTWNQAYWDIQDEQMSGYGHLPTPLDAEFKGFRQYGQV
jgi:hypothetical protein